ncbi:MAG: transposase [Thermoproteota archaeon]|nr:transposase [Thermoproteota archaeon]
MQRYRCTNCNHKFIINFGFEKARANPKTVTAALDLYFKGISLRKVCDHLQQFYGIKPSHATIINWIRKFVDVVKPYVDSIEPRFLSGIYHVDDDSHKARENGMGSLPMAMEFDGRHNTILDNDQN